MADAPRFDYYKDYLQLDKLLSCQSRLSEAAGEPAHDEHFYIIVHQVYELWFKQILFELDSVRQLFHVDAIDERSIALAVARLERIHAIQQLNIEQLPLLETMTPLDFLDFRHLLGSMSGFQSIQFRLIENKLGIRPGDRITLGGKRYTDYVDPANQEKIKASEQQPSLFELVERWLERTPFLNFADFNFLESYRSAVEKTDEQFEALFDEEKHQALKERGELRLSYRAMLAALFIMLYRDQPILHMPYRLINTLIELDESFTGWRYRHSLMVHRMIGRKMGTAGTSGYNYLKTTIERQKVFADFFSLSSFLIPRSMLPKLPTKVERNLGFYFS